MGVGAWGAQGARTKAQNLARCTPLEVLISDEAGMHLTLGSLHSDLNAFPKLIPIPNFRPRHT